MVKLFLAGDVMTGRGIDQALPHPGSPALRESYVQDARDYVALAEQRHGPIARPLAFPDIWGDALALLDSEDPDYRIVNLETTITTSNDFWVGKQIHYRMHPRNIDCLKAARIDCCSVANNHMLDFGRAGFTETIDRLNAAGIPFAGGGHNDREARAPAVLEARSEQRVLVFACAATSSGTPNIWGATPRRPGLHVIDEPSTEAADQLMDTIGQSRRPSDVVVVSIHWGGNWGHAIPASHRQFAHRLIDSGQVDIVHGHSSHHPMAIEVYRNRPIFYGCGDLVNDYEGIRGHEEYRGDLALMYFVDLPPTAGNPPEVTIHALCHRRLALSRAPVADVEWLEELLTRQGMPLGTRVRISEDGALVVAPA